MKLPILIAALAIASSAAAAPPDMGPVRAWRQSHETQILSDFTGFLAMPNVAANLSDVEKNAAYIEAGLKARGFSTRLLRAGPDKPPVVFGELQTGLPAGVAVLEVRDDLGREQLVAALGVLPVGHVHMQDQQRAEPTGFVDEPLDLCDRIVGRADDDLAELAQIVGAPLVDDALLPVHVFGDGMDPPSRRSPPRPRCASR